VNVGVVGLGYMGSNHVRVYSEMPEANLVAVADNDEERLDAGALRYGVRGYKDYREMFDRERLSAISIVVPTGLHREVALAAIASGTAALIEKPIGRSVQEGLEIQEAAERADVTVAVGHIELFNPAVRVLKERLRDDEIGPALQIQARRVGPFQPRLRDVGVVQDLATHDIGVMRYLLETGIARVHAVTRTGIRTPFEDTVFATLKFDNEVTGILDVNWLSPVKVRELQVIGERGMLRLDYVTQEVRCYQEDIGSGFGSQEAHEGYGKLLPVEKREPLRVELEAFLEAAAAHEQQPTADCADAIATLDAAEKLLESANSGESLDFSSLISSGGS
jgi:predicted dehydrogenase